MTMSRVAMLLLVASPAWASSVYPDELKSHLSLNNVPDCSLCHLNGITGSGTVNTPFGKSMRLVGMAVGGSQTAKIDTALDTLQTNNTDSDGDGTGDIAELKVDRDPNKKDAPVADGGTGDGGTGGGTASGGGSATGGSGSTGGGGEVIPPPRFGCGASTVPGLMTLLAGAFLLTRRRR